MANRIIDLLITYRIVKLMATDFKNQEAFKFGIIDAKGKQLRKNRELNTEAEKDSYTVLHRFVFNLKRLLAKFGLTSLINFSKIFKLFHIQILILRFFHKHLYQNKS